MRRKPRNLRPDELELWQSFVRNTKPIHGTAPSSAPKARTQPKNVVAEPPLSTAPRQPFRIGETAEPRTRVPDLASPTAGHVANAPLRMDRKRFGKMIKGRLIPEARIDLHGMTLAEAHPALNRFIFNAAGDGCRLVLVITGKGKLRDELGPIPARLGILRHQVPHWLHTMPLKPLVLQVTEAHARHGGSGAYYVYLRRS
ncbi:MAG: DNA mismatch repair protein MutS [Rhodobacterales bacterium]|nr:MAG: DNA mismatch repair protein MutS [Rhodobacterales bacterium]